MKIYGNGELTKLRNKIDKLLDTFSKELDSINNEYTPIYASLKRRRSNIIYYTVMTGFLFIIISFAVFLKIIFATYLILTLYGINLLLTGAGLFFLKRVNNDYYAVKARWDSKYKKILKYHDELNELYLIAEAEVYKVIGLTLYHDELEAIKDNENEYNKLLENKISSVKKEIATKLGDQITSEDVLSYYIEWGKKITGQESSDYDHLEVRRRKANL